jgi:hypothetical protein
MSSIRPESSVVPGALADAWRADTASTTELRRGYARFIRTRPTGKRFFGVVGWVVGGLVFGVGLAQAATLVHARWVSQQVSVSPSQPHSPEKPAPMAPAVVKPRALQPPLARPRTVPAAAAEASIRAPVTAGPAYVQEQWQQAAAALRDDDFARAESAFLRIERGVGGPERDAARLARAQLLASHGRTVEAETLATDLRDHAQAGLVRDKALALLTKIDAANRSARPGTATNQP